MHREIDYVWLLLHSKPHCDRFQLCPKRRFGVQVHPDLQRQKHMGITEAMLELVKDDSGPTAFWQTGVNLPRIKALTLMLREVALRILPGNASALGVERLWSAARCIFTDNRRSLLTQRLQQLLMLKLNIDLLGDDSMLESLGIKSIMTDDSEFDSIFQELAEAEVQEEWVARQADVMAPVEVVPVLATSDAPESDGDSEDVDPFSIATASKQM
jgi:hypothetical protein